MRETIRQMHNNGCSIDEIAEDLSRFECIQYFGERSERCNEGVNCTECWTKFLKEKLESL